MNFEVKIEGKAGFEGKAMLDFPTRAEKLKLIEELRELGYGSDDTEATMSNSDKINLASKMSEVVDARLVSIDVTHTESGVQITDKAMLDIYSECQGLVGVISHFILVGVSLGKAKS